MRRIAIVGEGVIGLSTALVLKRQFPGWSLTIFSDRVFAKTCSFGPAGIFRLDQSVDPRNKKWALATFRQFAELCKTKSAIQTGVKLLSGFIQSDEESLIKSQESAMADIVYNFRWLRQDEMKAIFTKPSKYGIHFTTYTSEGRRYVPWLKEQLRREQHVKFVTEALTSLKKLAAEHDFDAVINCAGIEGGRLAGDDSSVYPIRGVAFEVDAPWQKHFNYRNVDTFVIPLVGNTVMLGTQKQENRDDLEITDEDRRDIWERYLRLDPSFKHAKIVSEWSGLRPARATVRLESTNAIQNKNGAECHIVHNYGHAGNGFTMSWGCALDVVDILRCQFAEKSV